MPNYEFSCSSCQHTFDEIVPSEKRNDPLDCPQCGKKKTGKRAVTAGKVSYIGAKSNLSRAGTAWNDLLKNVKKGSGKANTIHTK